MAPYNWPASGEWPQSDPDSFSTFGERVAIARKARGLSQNKLAKITKCSQPLITQIEGGQVDDLKSELMFRLSDALQVSARWLVWGTGPVHKWEILSEDELGLIKGYRALPGPLKDHLQRVAMSLLSASAPASQINPFPVAKNKR